MVAIENCGHNEIWSVANRELVKLGDDMLATLQYKNKIEEGGEYNEI